MKGALGFVSLVCCAVAGGILLGALITALTSPPQPHRAICQQSHREVVLIPTVCGKHELCQRPIVTEVCDRVEMPAPRPEYRGTQDD